MHQPPAAILLLVENSPAVFSMWPDLRDHYLQLLVASLGGGYSASQGLVFLVLESMAIDHESVPRQYDTLQQGLNDIRFKTDPQNRVTVGKIWSGIEFLASTVAGQAARHIIIVAATSPFECDFIGHSAGSPWAQLPEKLAQGDIQLHIAVPPQQDMAPLKTLFEDALKLQNLVEERPSFPFDPWKLVFRLSAKPGISNLYSSTVPHTATSLSRVLPRRNNSFPSDPYAMSFRAQDEYILADSAEGAGEQPPSLVSQLQQVHGLTKKKVYGTKSTRRPFFREERVRKDSGNFPILPVPMVAGTGRVPSKTRAERAARVAHNGSPTEPYSRTRPGLPRRDSRLSSPETDPTSPTSYHMPTTMSPISPSAPNPYPQPASMSLPQSEPSWLQMQYPTETSPALSEPKTAPAYISQTIAHTPEANYSILAATAPSQPCAAPISQPPTPNASCEPKFVAQMSAGLMPGAAATLSRPSSRRVTCPEDEEPFTFDAGYVAATAALFKNEVLPAYPYLSPLLDDTVHASPYREVGTTPRQAFYIMQDNSVPPSPTAIYHHDPYAHPSYQEDLRVLHNPLSLDCPTVNVADSPPLGYAASYSSGSTASLTSSLTGWAG